MSGRGSTAGDQRARIGHTRSGLCDLDEAFDRIAGRGAELDLVDVLARAATRNLSAEATLGQAIRRYGQRALEAAVRTLGGSDAS